MKNARKQSGRRVSRVRRRLGLEAVESRLALSATAEFSGLDYQFDGTVLEHWLEAESTTGMVWIAPDFPRALPAESVQNLLTIVTSINADNRAPVQLGFVRDWLDQRGIEIQFPYPSADGGFIDLGETLPTEFGSTGDNETISEPSSPTPQSTPTSNQGGGTGIDFLDAWSSLGRPAVIVTENADAPGGPTMVGARTQSDRAERGTAADLDGGGWIALEPILAGAQDEAEITSVELAASDRFVDPLFGKGLKNRAHDEDALAGESARAAVFEMIGGEPLGESTSPARGSRVKPSLLPATPESIRPTISEGSQPTAADVSAIGLPPGGSLVSRVDDWVNDVVHWLEPRIAAALPDWLDEVGEPTTGDGDEFNWADYAGASALLLALALERIASQYVVNGETQVATELIERRGSASAIHHRARLDVAGLPRR